MTKLSMRNVNLNRHGINSDVLAHRHNCQGAILIHSIHIVDYVWK